MPKVKPKCPVCGGSFSAVCLPTPFSMGRQALGSIINNKAVIQVKCTKCGIIMLQDPNDFIDVEE
jgi:rRNA maturation protein Nop10